MSEKTKIPWADSTWNPWRGCSVVGPGCDNCYARKWGKRFGVDWGDDAPRVQGSEANWQLPFRWNRKPWICGECGEAHSVGGWCGSCRTHGNPWHRRRVFSLSLGDWLDPKVPVPWLARMLDTVRRCENVTWILCTKRPQLFNRRVLDAQLWMIDQCRTLGSPNNHEWAQTAAWLAHWRPADIVPPNVWLLASIENQQAADERIPHLLRIPAVVRGLSLEPLLGPVDIERWLVDPKNHRNTPVRLDWLIVGAERGPGARPCDPRWIYSIIHQGLEAGVPVFVKSLGNGQDDPAQWAEDLRVRQWPSV